MRVDVWLIRDQRTTDVAERTTMSKPGMTCPPIPYRDSRAWGKSRIFFSHLLLQINLNKVK